MESNKENVRPKFKSRIPLPLEPLPALSMHVQSKKEDKEKRPALRTIAETNAIPRISNAKYKQEKPTTKKIKLVIDSKHVTKRSTAEELDWDYKVFKDSDESVISKSHDDDTDKNTKEQTYFDENRQRNCLGERLAVTPSEKSPLQNKQLRNIKRSLKRPHSRELLGVSPACKQERRQEDRAQRRLVFNESLQDRLQSPDYWKKAYMVCINKDYTDDMLEYLLKVERKPLGTPAIPRITRACVINWLMKVNGPLGNPAIIQTACWYLDSSLGIGNIQLNRLQLVAAACYWIAQKIHGPVVHSARLVKCAANAFTLEQLLAAEKAVLNKLGFPVQPVTPHEFITYLAWWCDSDHPGEIEVAASFLCMSGLMVVKELCEEYPSVIACAAIKSAVQLLRKKDLVNRLQLCPMYMAAEEKAASLYHTCAILRRAVRIIDKPTYEFKGPLEHYGIPPEYIAQQIINSARQ